MTLRRCYRIDVLLHVTYIYLYYLFFFFNDPATTEIYTLSLHDALPILCGRATRFIPPRKSTAFFPAIRRNSMRSEEHTSELQSHSDLVCRLLLEKKKKKQTEKNKRTNKKISRDKGKTREIYVAN